MEETLGWASTRHQLKRHASSFTRLERGGARENKQKARLTKMAAMHAPDVLPSHLNPVVSTMPHAPSAPANLDSLGSRVAVLIPTLKRVSFMPRPRLSNGGDSSGASTPGIHSAPTSARGPTLHAFSRGLGMRSMPVLRRARAPPLDPSFFALPAEQDAALWQFRLAYRKFRIGEAKGPGEPQNRVARHRNVWRLRNSDFHKNIESADGYSLSRLASPGSPVASPEAALHRGWGAGRADAIPHFYSEGELQSTFARDLTRALVAHDHQPCDPLGSSAHHARWSGQPPPVAEHGSMLLPAAECELGSPQPFRSPLLQPEPHRSPQPCAPPLSASRLAASASPGRTLPGFKPASEFKRLFKLGRELGKGHFSTVHHARLRERPLSLSVEQRLGSHESAAEDQRGVEGVLPALGAGAWPGPGALASSPFFSPAPPSASIAQLEARLRDLSYHRRAADGESEAAEEETGSAFPCTVPPSAFSALASPASSADSSLASAQQHSPVCAPPCAEPCYPAEVAVKIIRKPSSEKQMVLLRREVQICARLSENPAFCRLLDRFESEDSLYLVLELCDGGELFDRICDDYGGAYPEDEARRLMRCLFEGIAAMHALGIVHRDLKVENVLFTDRELSTPPKISDFGLSRLVEDPSQRAMLTGCGTVGYVAPEILRKEAYNHKVDSFSLGVIAYIVLSGTEPFTGDNDMETAQRTKAGDFSFEGDEWDKVSPLAKRFIERCLHPDPDQRPSAHDALSHAWLTISHCAKKG